jgi:hypothetical protein
VSKAQSTIQSHASIIIGIPTPLARPPDEHRNTAKLSPILLNRTSGLSFAGDQRPRQSQPSSTYSKMSLDAAKDARRRRSSSLVYKEPPESLEQLSDQSALPNLNAEWVNAKGEHTAYTSVAYIRAMGWMYCWK